MSYTTTLIYSIPSLPTVEFGPGITSATEIRNSWPKLNDRRKQAMVLSLYPATRDNKKLLDVVVKLLDAGINDQIVKDHSLQKVTENIDYLPEK